MRTENTSVTEKNRTVRHKNIPVFIPHLGCPNNCVFCNQRVISGRQFFDENSVAEQIKAASETLGPDDEAEIAFFGGSFTGIDRGLMIRLLETANRFLSDPDCRVSSIRCSTRPDYIDGEILSILGKYNVGTVELGIQSTADSVLGACRRGHTADATERACAAVKKAGFRLIGQMMVGLPGALPEDEKATARFICAAGADGARIYPTVVFRKTELCEMTKAGLYTPLTDSEAVVRTADLLEIFDSAGVPVIRTGLCASESLSSADEVYGGAAHPAIGEMAMAEVFRRKIDAELEGRLEKRSGETKSDAGLPEVTVYVRPGCQSKAAGQHRSNISFIREKYRAGRIKILEKNGIIGYNILLSINY